MSESLLGYKTVALILLMAISLLAMLFDIWAVMIAAIISALTWNFFFIPPLYTFHIDNTEDTLLFILYFVIALVNAVLSFQIRKEEKKSRDKEEKENTIKLYDTLLNSLSHELRTPIATIVSSVDALKEQNPLLSYYDQIEILNQMEVASLRLNQQVENLLNMSKLESGMLKPKNQWLDVNELIHAAIYKIHSTAPNKQIVFNEDTSLPLCHLDPSLMDQVLYNILHNATLYTPIDSLIEISADIDQHKLTLNIADHGQGISSEYLPHIFEKFYRLPNSKPGGTGLGLSIVKGFVEAQNGTIAASNNKPHGLKITLSLPTQLSYINNLKNE